MENTFLGMKAFRYMKSAAADRCPRCFEIGHTWEVCPERNREQARGRAVQARPHVPRREDEDVPMGESSARPAEPRRPPQNQQQRIEVPRIPPPKAPAGRRAAVPKAGRRGADVHHPDVWLRDWYYYGAGSYNPNMEAIRWMRIDVWRKTEVAARNKGYWLPHGNDYITLELVQDAHARSELCADLTSLARPAAAPAHQAPHCQVSVVNKDCLVRAKELKEEYEGRVTVLNMANAYNPGGGYRTGAGAQE